MILKRFEKLPKKMQNNNVKVYYDILKKKKISLISKRIFDIVVSIILLIILLPFFCVLAIIIKIDSKGPVFYTQERVTQYGRKFKIFKFRTMVQNADKIGSLITIGKDPRITRIGTKIRKLRLDEVPQLINILIGDMSFVGTRPEVTKYVEKYTNEMMATLLMPAGVTSKASIEFKNEDEIVNEYLNKGEAVDEIYVKRILPKKMKWNLEYIKEFNFIDDIKLCIKTLIKTINLERIKNVDFK